MSTLNFTCNITTKTINKDEKITFIPFSQPFIIEASQNEAENPIEQAIPSFQHFHGENPNSFESITLTGTVGEEYPFVKFESMQRTKIWHFMLSLAQRAILTNEEGTLTYQLSKQTNSIEDFCEKTNINNSTHYPWISMIIVISELIQKFGEKEVFEKCVDNLAYHFIDNLYFGIPFISDTRTQFYRGKAQKCQMKISSFSEQSLQQLKKTPMVINKNTRFSSFDEYIEFYTQRYCDFSLKALKEKHNFNLNNQTTNNIKDEQELKDLSQHYLVLYKIISNKSPTFTCDNIPQQILALQQAPTNKALAIFIYLVEDLIIAGYLQCFNIITPTMYITDVDDKNSYISDNYLNLMKALLN